MNTTNEPRALTLTESAAIIRRKLKAAFTGTKFSVRSSRYSMGCSISVSWTGGPRTADVDAIIGRFQGVDFDGSDDSTSYRGAMELDGELVTPAPCYVSSSRVELDFEANRAKARAMILDRCETSGGVMLGSGFAVDDMASAIVRDADCREASPLEAAFGRIILRRDK